MRPDYYLVVHAEAPSTFNKGGELHETTQSIYYQNSLGAKLAERKLSLF
jgi:hypothetical protein